MGRSFSVSCAFLALTLFGGSIGCGGSKPKINYAKMGTVKKVAIVGVCGTSDAAWVDGVAARDRQPGVGASLIAAVQKGFETSLPGAATGREVVPLSTVAGVADLPKANAMSPNFTCASSVSPFVVGGKLGAFNAKPDKTLLRLMAEKLGADAVVAVAINFALNTGGDGARLMAGTFNPVKVFVVDNTGEIIMQASFKGLDTPKVAVEKQTSVGVASTTFTANLPPGAYDALGTSFGQLIAAKVGEAMAGGGDG